ncbi:ATP binding L-PSP endoribonuclease family protein-like protein [Boeremia exigua]|uniref:ATP binding L-PSP endoribonuclease family protein-like protein n=1 Tax=Boeremia exigua TaxID=749465 RepID=UPI001E8CA09D|nr:ATP binding L-PSP endoribonuclease family protein-like protein [Boeremia exigua]KAH6629831.1 ATP binding L-PSP endoribonuclease family protein-like protein [Boeremia exigua]
MALNVIALVSGGKDSFFSILHCTANGHKVVALANLHPSTPSDNEDTNSYMYQTVGHSVIPLYEQALGIPLYRQEITGKAVNAERDYSAPLPEQEQDETEDLIPLLQKAMRAHPEANAVSTGAILSTYQRTRVESVAVRLGLTPLSYLWQYPLLPPYSQSQLLLDMAAVGQEAIVIKTASGGLDERILGWNVAAQSTITKLQKAMARFGEESNGAVLGEGGEFETLALDGPRPLWKKRIRIEPGAAGVSEGGQSVLKMRASELEDKSEEGEELNHALRIPEMWDDEFKRLLEVLEGSVDTRSFMSDDATLLNEPVISRCSFDDLPRNASADTPTVFTYANLADTSRSSIHDAPSPSRQLTKILLRLDHVLKQWNLSRTAINQCTLLLRSMSDFTVLNPIYAQYFSSANPPARVTVAVGSCMPESIDVMLSITLDKPAPAPHTRKRKPPRPTHRQGLHVQGLSYWAPANIGPYSQAISAPLPSSHSASHSPGATNSPEIVYVAGQIPLIPASMQPLTAHGFAGQTALALQHLTRIGRAKGVRWWTHGVAYIAKSETPEERVRTALAAWSALHSSSDSVKGEIDDDEDDDEDDVVDPWDRRNTHAPSFVDATRRAPVPDRVVLAGGSGRVPPCFVVEVEGLPRGVDIEWSVAGLAIPESTSQAVCLARSPVHPGLTLTTIVPSEGGGGGAGSSTRFLTLELATAASPTLLRSLGAESVRDWTAATLYASPSFEWSAGVRASMSEGMSESVNAGAKMSLRGVQWVPCRRVWGEGGREVQGVVVGRCDGGGMRVGGRDFGRRVSRG